MIVVEKKTRWKSNKKTNAGIKDQIYLIIYQVKKKKPKQSQVTTILLQ